VGDIDGFPRPEYRPRDADAVGEADFGCPESLAQPGVQLVGFFIIQKKGGAFGVQHPHGFRHNLAQECAQVDFGGRFGHHVKKRHFLRAEFVHPLRKDGALQRDGGLRGDRFEKHYIFFRESPFLFVQDLGDADDFVFGCLDWNAEN